MINEKIVVYLKNAFKQYNDKISLKDFKELYILIHFLYNKGQYIDFVLKEYTIMRKKFCESIIKDKYLILSSKNVDSVYTNLNEDFMFYFMKELILISFFFLSEELSIISIEDAYELSKYIKDSAVIKYDGCTHYAYLERLGQTINIIDSFIGDKHE